MADLKDIINLIEKREKADKQSKPLEEWISTKEGKTVVDSLPIEERSFLKDIFNKYQGSNLSKVLGAVKKLSPDEIRIGISKDFNKGGMPKMQEQMDLFEQGGLKDEGGMKDPVSGNKVPVGSTRKEVRDDIPAMVSEGEFIFPADVTRYIGLDKLMQLRQDAKRGLVKMEQMGQMGGSPIEEKNELPFTSADIVILSESGDLQEFDEGGMPRNLKTLDRNSSFYSSPEYINWVNSGGMGTTDMYTSKDGNVFTSGTVGRMYDNWLAGQSMGNKTDSVSKRITFKDVMGENQIFFKEYRNATGESITISFIGNVPLQPIPEGYTYYDPNNPDDHPSSNVSDTASTENPLVELSPEGDGAYNDVGEWTGQGSAAQMARDKVDTASMTNTEFANHVTKVNGKGRNMISAVLGLINPVMGLVSHTATAYNDRALQKEMESRLAKTDLSVEDRAAITAALDVTKARLDGKLTSTILGIVDELASTFNLTPQQVEEVKQELVNQNDSITTTINKTDPATKTIAEVVNEVTAKYSQQKADKLGSQQMTTDQRFTDEDRMRSSQTGGLPPAQTIGNLEGQYSTSPSNVPRDMRTIGSPEIRDRLPDSYQTALPNINYLATPNYKTQKGKEDYEKYQAARLANEQMVTDQMYMPPAVSQAETLGYPISKIDTDKLDDQTVYELGTNIANQMANMQMTTGYPGKDMSAATKAQFGEQVTDFPGFPEQPITDDYGNAITANYGGGPYGYYSQTPQGIQDPSGLRAFDTVTGIDDSKFSAPIGVETGIQDPSKAPAVTSPVAAGQGFDIGVEAPKTALGIDRPTIRSYSNVPKLKDTTIAAPFSYHEQNIKDIFPGYTLFPTSVSTPSELQEPVGDPAAARAATNQKMVDAYKDYNPYGTTVAPTQTIGNLEGQYSTSPSNVPTAQQLSNQQMITNQMMGLTPTPSAGKYAYAKDYDYKFDPLKAAEEAKKQTEKLTPSMDYDPNAYTGSGLNDTIAKGGKIAGKTSVEGVVENPNKPGYVSRVSIPTSGDDINVTVFKDSTGNLYAKNYMGTTYSVVPDKKSPSGYTADLTSEYKGPGDAQKQGIVDFLGSKFKDITSPFTKKPTTKTPIDVSEKSTSTPTYSEASPGIGGCRGYTGDFGAPDKDPTGYGGTGGYGMFNQGGLAAKKPKKKTTRKYKKGGLATSKK